jgi:hypothetical protein
MLTLVFGDGSLIRESREEALPPGSGLSLRLRPLRESLMLLVGPRAGAEEFA